MENDSTLTVANQAIDKRIAMKEAQLKELEERSAQLSILVAQEDAFVQRLRIIVKETEQERLRLKREFHRLVPTG